MKPQHQTFILGMIKHGDKIQAYRAAYPKCTNDETARKSAERILHHHPEVAAEIEEAAANIRQRAYAEAYRQHVEQQKTPLLSMMKRREILAQIATCQMKVGRFVKNGDRYIMIFEDPRPRDIMQAMQIDVKMEDACNRMRNCNDPFFSQFNIYIDGRPCDQPHLPPDPNLPPGIYMLPRRRKNKIEGTGIKKEQNLTQHLPLQGAGGQNSGINRGASSMPQIENQNSGINLEQNTSPLQGDLGVPLAPEKSLIENSGIKMEQITSPLEGDLGVPLAPEKSLIENSGINLEQNTSPLQGDLGVSLAPEQNTTQYRPPLGGDRGADPLAASFYKQDKQARESAPPPHILTPEEVKELDEEYARRRRNEQPVKPSTFGKMYFKEKDSNYDNLE